MATKIWWFVVYPASEHPGNAFPANARIVSAQEGSAAYNAWVNGSGVYTIAGIAWERDAGPFPTRKQAQQWAPKPLGIIDYVGAGIAGVLIGAGGQQPSTAVPEGQKVAADAPYLVPLAGLAGSAEAFFTAVSDGKMWRSLGWILLGILLMLAGVALWIGPGAARFTPAGRLAGELG